MYNYKSKLKIQTTINYAFDKFFLISHKKDAISGIFFNLDFPFLQTILKSLAKT